MEKPKTLSDILRSIFVDNFVNFDLTKEPNPEEFIGGEFTKTISEGVDEITGDVFTITTYVSKDGKRIFTRKVLNAKSTPFASHQYKSNKLYRLQQDLQTSIESQEFEKSAKIRDEIGKLKEELKNKS